MSHGATYFDDLLRAYRQKDDVLFDQCVADIRKQLEDDHVEIVFLKEVLAKLKNAAPELVTLAFRIALKEKT